MAKKSAAKPTVVSPQLKSSALEDPRVLKQTGSFYCHCDWHASHYVKVMLDQIFGENNSNYEIVWN
jgi:hypothetical protein